VEDEDVVGIISIGDLVKFQSREQSFQIQYLTDTSRAVSRRPGVGPGDCADTFGSGKGGRAARVRRDPLRGRLGRRDAAHGRQFTSETALLGNDLSTFPDFPAEIRAPAGSLPGVSGFQLHFADHDILTPGDRPDVLVAMNPAALKTNLKDLVKGGTLIVNRDAFTERNLDKAGYARTRSRTARSASSRCTTSADVDDARGAEGDRRHEARGGAREEHVRARADVVALQPPDRGTLAFLDKKFAKAPNIRDANVKAFHAGYAFGETTETFAVSYEVKPATLAPGTYRNITGNQALAYGLIAASKLSGLPLFLGAYPITPASAILEELARHKNFGVRTFQAEDEIAAVGAASARRSAARSASARPRARGSSSSRRRSASRSRSSCRC
jgi:2-oxoglutarate ferredoxin oxidoreductase subunit alpha